jgi:hypothetical protein
MLAVAPTATITVIVQLPVVVVLGAIGIVPPESEIRVAPATALNVPPQVVVPLTMARPAPIVLRLSEKEVIAAAVVVSLLVSVIVSVEFTPIGALVGLKAFDALAPLITSVSVAATVLLPKVVCSAPTGIVLVDVAMAAPAPIATGTVIVQVPGPPPPPLVAIGMTPPDSESKVVPETAVTVLPHVVVTVPPIVKPAPIVLRLSAKLVIGADEERLGLLSVMVSVCVEPRAALVVANAFVTVTGVIAVTVSVAVVAA